MLAKMLTEEVLVGKDLSVEMLRQKALVEDVWAMERLVMKMTWCFVLAECSNFELESFTRTADAAGVVRYFQFQILRVSR